MKEKILLLLLLLMPLVAQQGRAADNDKLLLVYYRGTDGMQRLDVFPTDLLIGNSEYVNGQLRVVTANDTAFCYNEATVDSVATLTKKEVMSRLPSIVQLKFNNKYNDQVFTDVVADIAGDSVVTATVGAIGKWLTPSIQVSDDSARIFVGRERQLSKQSRLRFDVDRYYTIAMPRQRVYEKVLVKDATWGDDVDEFIETPIALDASMFSGNLPGKDGEGFGQMLDGDVSTIYHSTWDVPQQEKEVIYKTEPYIDIALQEAERRIRFDYTTRNAGDYAPLKLTLYASKDGTQWKAIRTFNAEEDGLPLGQGETYESPMIDLGDNYSYLRLQLNQARHRLYFVLAEFRLWHVAENPDYHGGDPVEPAEYAYLMMPFGREYRVHVDWLTDRAEQVPRIDIDIENGEMVQSKDYYLNATITIDGAGVFPSMEPTPVQIKGRGNSSWSSWAWDKNPYRLKFEEKQKPFGLTKGKNWVLLANKQSGSMTSNAIGMKAACLVGTAGANHIVPVELYMNGEYRGSYNFTEKVGFSNNSIDLDDETGAALLELDTYFDETYKFHSAYYGLPVNIKEPDFSEGGTHLTQQMIEDDFNAFMQTLKSGKEIAGLVDIDMLGRFLMVNDLILNLEPHHPKSTFLYKEFVGNSDSKFVFGPVWDLDWAFGYEMSRSYFQSDYISSYWNARTMESTQFVKDLRNVSKQLDKVYYQLWVQFRKQALQELIDYCDDYYAYARPSLEHNATMWGDGTGYARTTENAKKWLKRRADGIFNRLTAYDVDDDTIEDDTFGYQGDADGIENISSGRATKGDGYVYDLQGRRVGTLRSSDVETLRSSDTEAAQPLNHSTSQLPKGIYIVNGKKVVLR